MNPFNARTKIWEYYWKYLGSTVHTWRQSDRSEWRKGWDISKILFLTTNEKFVLLNLEKSLHFVGNARIHTVTYPQTRKIGSQRARTPQKNIKVMHYRSDTPFGTATFLARYWGQTLHLGWLRLSDLSGLEPSYSSNRKNKLCSWHWKYCIFQISDQWIMSKI